MIKIFTLFAAIALSFTAYSQVTVSGTVRDELTNETLPGVNILLQGTSSGVITNFEGVYQIEVAETDTLLFSFIGYDDKVIAVGNRTNIDVIMFVDIMSLDEVVITALDIKRDKASLGYSVSQLDASEVNVVKENNVMNSLSGKVAGLQINTGNNGVDGSSRILLRGVTTIEGNNRPLIVVDGIPIVSSSGGSSMWGGTDGGDALSDINPDDIESMSVLKGAGASAAYGSLGMHGVILITTKTGAKKDGIGLSFGSNLTTTHIALTPDLQYEYGTGAFDQFAPIGSDGVPNLDYPFSWAYGPKLEGQPYTNWLGKQDTFTAQGNPYDEFYQTGISFTNSLALQGATDKSTFRMSFTDQRAEGIVKNNTLVRRTYNMRASTKLTERFSVNGKVTYIKTQTDNRPQLAEGGGNTALLLGIKPADVRLKDLENNTVDADGNEIKWSSDQTFINPYWTRDHMKNNTEKDRFQGVFSAKFDINENFWITARTGMDYNLTTTSRSTDRGALAESQGRGFYSNSKGNAAIWNSDLIGTYQVNIGQLGINATLGANYRKEDFRDNHLAT